MVNYDYFEPLRKYEKVCFYSKAYGYQWFAMWQSQIWNGKETAMDITIVWIGFAILLALKDEDLDT